MKYPSPLRYPGGKRKIASFIADAIVANKLEGGTYVEPYAGGASVALQMLFTEHVNSIVINDVDRSIYAFWHSVVYETERLIQKIYDTPVTMQEWYKQKDIQNLKQDIDLLTLAFSTFFLNRTNRSGILGGGVIGGINQAGKWKMDARFNKTSLIERIKRIALYGDRIQIFNKDAIDLIRYLEPVLDERTLIYFDPPYYKQGATLYAYHYTHADHIELSDFILNLDYKWILTYDYTPQIIEMYAGVEKRRLTLSYTAANKTKGKEMIAFCSHFIIPDAEYKSISIQLNENENENENEKSYGDTVYVSSHESSDVSSSTTDDDVFITMPLNDGSMYGVPETDLSRYVELYPAVDVEQELRNMVGWLESNRAKRKTRNGIRRFITNWLSRAQNTSRTVSDRPISNRRYVRDNRHNFTDDRTVGGDYDTRMPRIIADSPDDETSQLTVRDR